MRKEVSALPLNSLHRSFSSVLRCPALHVSTSYAPTVCDQRDGSITIVRILRDCRSSHRTQVTEGADSGGFCGPYIIYSLAPCRSAVHSAPPHVERSSITSDPAQYRSHVSTIKSTSLSFLTSLQVPALWYAVCLLSHELPPLSDAEDSWISVQLGVVRCAERTSL